MNESIPSIEQTPKPPIQMNESMMILGLIDVTSHDGNENMT